MGIQEQKYTLFTQVFHIPSALCNGTFVLLLKPNTSLPILIPCTHIALLSEYVIKIFF